MENGDLEERWTDCFVRATRRPTVNASKDFATLLEQARAKRRDSNSRPTPTARCRLSRLVDDIEATEDASSMTLLAEAEASDDERRKEVTRGLVDQKKMQRDLMSERIGERLGEYQDYEFVSSEAREQFEQLMPSWNATFSTRTSRRAGDDGPTRPGRVGAHARQ